METIAKLSVWVVILVLAGGQLNELVQTSMVNVGILEKPIQMQDACKLEILPTWFEKALGCEKEEKKIEEPKRKSTRPKLNLGGDLLKKYKFETREKSFYDVITEKINKGFVFVQRLFLPEKFVMPCLLGDCDMGEKIKKEREQYENLLRRKVPAAVPDEPEVAEKRKTAPSGGQ